MNASITFSSLSTQSSRRSSRSNAYLFLVVLAFLAVGTALWSIVSVQASPHAALKHGVSAEDAAFCFSGGGELQLSATNPANGRCATVALMVSRFFIRIQEPDGHDVTMFCKEKMQCIEQVKQYLRNRGYEIH